MKKLGLVLIAGIVAVVLAACSNTDAADSKTYNLDATGATLSDTTTVSNVSGTAVFTKLSATETQVTLTLANTVAGVSHPAHIHVGDKTDGGAIYVTLNSVNGTTGTSATNVTETDNGAAITYEQLIAYDGYINIHESADQLGIVVANGEVGSDAAGNSEAD